MSATPLQGLAAIRAQLAELLAEIDMAELPPPDRVRRGAGTGNEVDRSPGADWEPAHSVKVFTIDTADSSGAVYVADVRWGYSHPSDWEAFKPTDARRLGMALLAAANWADRHRPAAPPAPDNVRTIKRAAS